MGAISLERPPMSRTILISAALFAFCAGAYFISPVHEVTDSHYSMLVSENISLARAAAMLLIAASVFVQAPGALSHSSWLWNADPSPEHLWDWTDPQFLHWKHPDIRRTGTSQVTGRALAENGAPPPVPLVLQPW
jgi:hypothetical protein